MEATVEDTLREATLSRRPGVAARLQWTSPQAAALIELQALLGAGELREVTPTRQIRQGYFMLEIDLAQVPEALRNLLPPRCRSISDTA